MNPTSSETAGMQLPPPMEQPLAAANPVGVAEQAPSAPEQVPAIGAEGAPAAQQSPQMVVPAIPLPLPSIPPALPQDAGIVASQASATDLSDDDTDLIEKEWVNKAKQIVALNRNDPYKQSEELTVFRADYMKKHYDKNIKLSK
jgi:hypothetical protein